MPRPARTPVTGNARKPYAPRMAPAERREQLLDAAMHVVLEHGPSGVSIEAIARMAGVTRPVIYDHFPNLGSLIHVLVAREETIALGQLAEAMPDLDPPESGNLLHLLQDGIPRLLEAVASRPLTWRMILLPLAGTPTIVRDHVESNLSALQGRIEAVTRASIDAGVVRADLDPELAARAILAFAEDAGRMVLTDPESHYPARYESFVKLLLNGVTPTA